jgi:hypothetical protein
MASFLMVCCVLSSLRSTCASGGPRLWTMQIAIAVLYMSRSEPRSVRGEDMDRARSPPSWTNSNPLLKLVLHSTICCLLYLVDWKSTHGKR